MTASLPAMLVDQLGTGPTRIALRLWPQIMASAREHLIPWIDQNAPELAGPTRLAFQDLDIVADELRHAVRSAWRRLRVVLVGQTVELVTAGDGEWAIWVTSRLCNPAPDGAPVIELKTKERLRRESLPEEICAEGRPRFRSASIDIVQIRDDLLSEPT
jgi:hypothetical protein